MLTRLKLANTARSIRPIGFNKNLVSYNTYASSSRSRFYYSTKTASSSKGTTKSTKSRRLVILGITGGTFGVLYLTNDSFKQGVRHSKLAFGRIATVTVACTRCFRHYYKTLNANYQSDEDYQKALSNCHVKCAEITRKAIEKNAGVFIKLGQHIAALTYIFPDEWTTAMIPLQDRCPTSTFEDISEMIQYDTGKSIDELFTDFDHSPLGTASLAQVHKATLKSNNQQVAVKVQHPSLEEFVPLDVLMTKTVFNLIDYFFKDYPLVWLSDELQNSIFVELDFREEAKNAQKTQDYFRDYYNETALRVPDVIWSERRILVMEFLQGARADNIEFLDEHNISRSEVSSCLSHIFNNMIFTPGVGLHCDPHGGNMAIIKLDKPRQRGAHNFEIILYDHGLYRDVPIQVRRDYAHFWLSLIDGNEELMKYYAHRFAGIDESQFKLFSAAITGRDFDNATSNVVSKRSKDEVKNMTTSLTQNGLISDIMVLLHSMPRIVLLILKTNDLTRYLDEKLDNPLGPERTFLIMATYCARTVYNESRERIAKLYPNIYSLRRIFEEIRAWWVYVRRESQLTIYDVGMKLKSVY